MPNFKKKSTRSYRSAKKSTSRSTRRKKTMTKKKSYRRSSTVRIQRGIVAPRTQVKLTYWDQLTMEAVGLATYAEYNYAANGVYDPNLEIAGHQPRGFDQWAALYGTYLVKGLAYDVTFRFSSVESGIDVAVVGMAGIHFGSTNEGTLFNSVDDFMERPKDHGERRKHWSAGSSTAREVSTVYGPTNFKGFINCSTIKKLYQPTTNWPEDYNTAVTSNPATGLRQDMLLWVGSISQGTGTSSAIETNNLPDVIIEVLLTYYIEFGDPTELGPS